MIEEKSERGREIRGNERKKESKRKKRKKKAELVVQGEKKAVLVEKSRKVAQNELVMIFWVCLSDLNGEKWVSKEKTAR